MIQKAFEQTASIRFVVLFECDAELAQDVEQEFARRALFSLDRCGNDALVELPEHAPDQIALAAAMIRDHDTEARPRPQGMAHELQRTQMLIAWEKEGVVGGISKRSRLQP